MTKRSVAYLLGAVLVVLIVAWMWRQSGDPQRMNLGGPIDSGQPVESSAEHRSEFVEPRELLPEGLPEPRESIADGLGAKEFRDPEGVRRITVGDAPEILIEGRVVNEADGSPVAGAELAVSDPAPDASPLLLAADEDMKFRSDDLGRFRLELKRRQNFVLSVEAEGFRRRTLSGIEPVSRSGLIVSLAPLLKVEGVVVDPLNRGVPEAAVWVNRSVRDDLVRNVDWTYTDKDGRFEFSRVAEPGEYLIAAAHPEHMPHEPAAVTLERGENSLKLTLEPTGDEDLASIWGRVADAEGFPVAGAEVSIGESVSLGFGMRLASTHTDRDGLYRFSSVRMGRYNLSCRADGFATTDRSRFAPVTVDEPGIEYRQDCTLSPEAHLSGTVFDEEGVPVARASVAAHQPMGPGLGYITNEDGRFLLEGLASGEYTVDVRHSDYQTLLVQVNVPHEGDLQLRLRKGLAIYGTASDLQGKPIDSFTLHLTDPTETHPWKRTRVNAPDGRFRMQGISAGTYSMTLRTDDGRSYSGPLQIGEDLWAALRIDLSRQEGGPLFIQTSTAPPGLR